MIAFREFQPSDVMRLDLQASQVAQFGIFDPVRDLQHGRELDASGPAWTALDGDGGVIACAGFAEVFGGVQAYAWALLGRLGPAHFAVRRFIAERLAEAPYRSIEAMARADMQAERRWLELLGFELCGKRRAWGPLSQDHLIFERVAPGSHRSTTLAGSQ